MTHETKTFKHFSNGWTSETTIDLNHKTEEGRLHLNLATLKRYSGQLATTASVRHGKDDGCFTFIMFQDYSKTVITEKARVSEKTCLAQHQQALAMLPQILEEVKAKYNIA